MFRIGSVNCEDFPEICKKEGIDAFPTYKVYPPMPIPIQEYKEPTLEVDTDKLKKMAYKWVGDRIVDITSLNHETFKNDNVGKPKMLLFTDKKSHPIVYKALSAHFDVSFFTLSISENSRFWYRAQR